MDSPALRLLQDIVAINSVNPRLPCSTVGEAKMFDFLTRFFEELGLPFETYEVLPGRSNIVARLEGQNPDRSILFESHMDTVTADGMEIPPFDPQIRDGKLYGRGSCDTKGTGAGMLQAIREIVEAGQKPPTTVIFAGVVDEELGMAGSTHLAEVVTADAAVIGEPTNLEVVHAHKGIFWQEVCIKGKAAHSSMPEDGVNAISKAAALIQALEARLAEEFSAIQHPLLGKPTYSVGMIEGGRQFNTVPDLCNIRIDHRLVPGVDNQKISSIYRDVFKKAEEIDPELAIELLEPEFYAPPVETELECPITQTALSACEAILGEAKTSVVPYATDASQLTHVMPCIVLGPGSIEQAHQAVEWIDCQQVIDAVKVYKEIMLSYKGS